MAGLPMIIKQIIAGVQMNKFQRKKFKKPRKYFPGFPYLPLSIKPLSAPCSMPYLPPWKEAYFSSTHDRDRHRERQHLRHTMISRKEMNVLQRIHHKKGKYRRGQRLPKVLDISGQSFPGPEKKKRNHPCCHRCQNADSNRENLFI